MKTRTAFALALLSVVSVIPDVAHAQDRQARDRQAQDQQATDRQPADRQQSIITERPAQRPSNPLNLPTSPILPMTNPVAPITTAPVQPFIRYVGPEGRPTVVVPPATANAPGPDRRRSNRNCCDVPVVIVDGPYLPSYPYYDPAVYGPQLTPAPVPGTLPGTYPVTPSPQVPVMEPIALPAPASSSVSTYYPEPNVIITPEAPPLVVEPPSLGTSRAEAVARYGEPWGSVTMRGRETLYFRGGLEVVFENGKAVEVR